MKYKKIYIHHLTNNIFILNIITQQWQTIKQLNQITNTYKTY